MTTKHYSLEELRMMRESITQEEWDADAYIGADDYDDPDLPFVQIGDIRWTPNKVDIPAAIETNDNARVMAAAPALLDQLIETMEADRWIPVSERLPENDTSLWFYSPTQGRILGELREEGRLVVIADEQADGSCNSYKFDIFSHWKPLPPAPEKDLEGE